MSTNPRHANRQLPGSVRKTFTLLRYSNVLSQEKKKSLKNSQTKPSGQHSLPLRRRDGYRGTDTFPAQNRECLSCARPAPCNRPLLPCSVSMASMSQGRWMRKPRSEYEHTPLAQARAEVRSSDVSLGAALLVHLEPFFFVSEQ